MMLPYMVRKKKNAEMMISTAIEATVTRVEATYTHEYLNSHSRKTD